MTVSVFERLDRLIRCGSITGYTVEPPPLYLESRLPALTYSMYSGDELSRRNIDAVVDELDRLDASLSLRPVQGNVGRAQGRIERTEQVRVAASFTNAEHLNEALRCINRSYLASSGAASQPASWVYPDVRLVGLETAPTGTIGAFAHTMPVGVRSVVVMSLSRRPPLEPLLSYPIFLLERWARYLGGQLPVVGWTAPPTAGMVSL